MKKACHQLLIGLTLALFSNVASYASDDLTTHLLDRLKRQEDFEEIQIRASSGEPIKAHMLMLSRYPYFEAKFKFKAVKKASHWTPKKEWSGPDGKKFSRKIVHMALAILYAPDKASDIVATEKLSFGEHLDLVKMLHPIWSFNDAQINRVLGKTMDQLFAIAVEAALQVAQSIDLAGVFEFVERYKLYATAKKIRRVKLMPSSEVAFSEDFLVEISGNDSPVPLPEFVTIAGNAQIPEFQTTKSNLTQRQWTLLWARFLVDILPNDSNPSFFKERKYCPDTFVEMPITIGDDREILVAMCPEHPVELIDFEVHLTSLVTALNAQEKDHGRRPDGSYNVYFISSELETKFARNAAGNGTFPWGNDEGQIGRHAHFNGNSMVTVEGMSWIQTWPVGAKDNLTNGIDISGGVWTWTSTRNNSRVRILGGGAYDAPEIFRLYIDYPVAPGLRDRFLGARLSRRLVNH